MLYQYREHFHLSEVQALNDPWEAVERHFVISELRRERDKLETKRQKHNNR